MSRQLAPVLTRHLTDGGTITPLTGLTEARAELRALEAVVRADLAALRPGYRGQHEAAKARALARLEKRRVGR